MPRQLFNDWEKWIENVASLYLRYTRLIGETPFLNETASVSVLASAAALAGFLPLAEYAVAKRGYLDKRLRYIGRTDLWFRADSHPSGLAYAFEFKTAWQAATLTNLSVELRSALLDAACIPRDEYDYAAGGLIARVAEVHRLPTYLSYAQTDEVDLAFQIGPDASPQAMIYFKLVR